MKSLANHLQNNKGATFIIEAMHQPEPQKMFVNSGNNSFPMINANLDGL